MTDRRSNGRGGADVRLENVNIPSAGTAFFGPACKTFPCIKFTKGYRIKRMQQQNNVVRIPHLCDGIRYCRHRVEPCFVKRKQIDKDDVRVIVAEIFDLIGFWRRIFGEFKSRTRLVLQFAGDVGFGNAQC